MPVLPKEPLIYEINTWVWLAELSRRHKSPITLANVPAEEWEAIASFGFEAVWLMGVWQRRPAGARIARATAPLLRECRKALSDFTPDDIPGSPYCIRDYTADERLGGPESLYRARTALADCGLGLILDFVPNHVALDHNWIPGSFISTITGLESGTYYYVRAYATNSAGTSYGKEFNFLTPLTDPDGNVYRVIMIGSQVWMAENLRTSKFSDKTVIPYITDNLIWMTTTEPGYCQNPGFKSDMSRSYGALYNWHAVKTGRLCPTGWHVPDDEEWDLLTGYLGDESIAGGMLKEQGLVHWVTPNLLATDAFGFTALPGGYRRGSSPGYCSGQWDM